MPVWRVVLLLALLGCGAAPAAPPGSGGVAMDSGGQATTSAGAPNGGMSSGGAAAGVSAGGGGAGGEGGGPLGGTPGGASGAGGAAGGLALCGEPSVPEPEPAVAPAAVAVDASAKTLLKSGNFDDAGTDVLAPSAAAGVVLGTRSGSELWQWAESGAWLEYAVEVATAGSYSIVVLYYSAEAGGIATLSVDDQAIGVTRFGARDQVGEYGGVPNCCSRGHGLLANLSVGTHRLRVTVSPRSVPLDVYGLQLNFAGRALENGGKVHVLPADGTTTLPSDGVSDFYRMNFDVEQQAWPCQKSFCRVEYLVQPEQAGHYQLSLRYTKQNEQCMGVGFQLEDTPLPVFRLDQAATVTPPIELDLPCGVTRISVRNPNYVDGEFCSYGAMFGALELERANPP